MSGKYAHAHAIFTRRYFFLDQHLGTRLICLPVAAGWLIDVIGDTGISVRVPVRCSLHRGQCKEMQIVEWEIFAFNFDWCVIRESIDSLCRDGTGPPIVCVH